MKDQRLEIKDIIGRIDNATLGKLDVPEFQRKFVWPPEKTKNFVDSLWRGYPVGTVLLWESTYNSPKSAIGTQSQKQWIVDGQQRITSLALLFGKKPYWWAEAEEWNEYLNKYDVLVNVKTNKDSLEFGLPNPIRKKSHEWVSVREILTTSNLTELANDISSRLGNGSEFSLTHEKLQSIKKLENFPIFEIIVDHELEDVAEIFSRLNTAGTKIKESDVIIALVASKQKGWIREKFDPFLKDLEDKGFELDPSILIRTLAVVGKGLARLKDVPSEFWDPTKEFEQSWKATQQAITYIQKNLSNYGVLSADLLPAHNVLIPLFALKAKFNKEFKFKKAFYWFLLATRDGRYSGSAVTVLDQDVKVINASKSFDQAVNDLIKPLDPLKDFSKEDFLKEYRDEFKRLILYLTIFKNEAKDWIEQDLKIGYDRSDNQLNEGFKPEWHHFFPKKVLKGQFDETKINALANIVVLNEKANRTFTSRKPQEYLETYKVKNKRLTEQLIPTKEVLWQIERFEDFLEKRASDLSDASNKFMKELKKG